MVLLMFSCNDGDLQIETIDFDSEDIQFCDPIPEISSTIFFKINSKNTLILELQDGILQNEDSGGEIISPVPGSSKITYRTFTEDVSKSYFCDDIPPASPTVLEEINAEGGSVFVTTVRSVVDTTLYEHTIEFSGISLINSKGERITDLSINNFGTITTSQE